MCCKHGKGKKSATSDTAQWAPPHHKNEFYVISLEVGRHHGRRMALAVSMSAPTYASVPLVTRVAVAGCDIWAAQRVGEPQVA